ncbi:MAG: hypothetical protein ACRDZQ_03350 [Acidimicrobiales bacterium]
MTRRGRKLLFGIIIPVLLGSCALAWRDLGERPADRIRGRKNVWRAFITVNPGNSLFYWLFGRR